MGSWNMGKWHKSNIIVNGFKKSGITAKDDGSEDDMANIENEDIDLISDSFEKRNTVKFGGGSPGNPPRQMRVGESPRTFYIF